MVVRGCGWPWHRLPWHWLPLRVAHRSSARLPANWHRLRDLRRTGRRTRLPAHWHRLRDLWRTGRCTRLPWHRLPLRVAHGSSAGLPAHRHRLRNRRRPSQRSWLLLRQRLCALRIPCRHRRGHRSRFHRRRHRHCCALPDHWRSSRSNRPAARDRCERGEPCLLLLLAAAVQQPLRRPGVHHGRVLRWPAWRLAAHTQAKGATLHLRRLHAAAGHENAALVWVSVRFVVKRCVSALAAQQADRRLPKQYARNRKHLVSFLPTHL